MTEGVNGGGGAAHGLEQLVCAIGVPPPYIKEEGGGGSPWLRLGGGRILLGFPLGGGAPSPNPTPTRSRERGREGEGKGGPAPPSPAQFGPHHGGARQPRGGLVFLPYEAHVAHATPRGVPVTPPVLR
jgi:hypothetical protein